MLVNEDSIVFSGVTHSSFVSHRSSSPSLADPTFSTGYRLRRQNRQGCEASRQELLRALRPSAVERLLTSAFPFGQLVLDSKPHPIFHFGMSGTAIVKGEAGPVYRAPRAKTDACVWPPKYSKVGQRSWIFFV